MARRVRSGVTDTAISLGADQPGPGQDSDHYCPGGEYRGETVQSLMMAPYQRIVILHVAIIAGGFGVAALGSPLPLLVLLVSLKLVLDVWLHRREHRTSAARAEVSSTAVPS